MKNIYLINDNKYKSIFIDYNFTFKVTKEELSQSVVIASILSKCSNKFKNQNEIYEYLLNLYGATFDVGVQKIGEYFNIEFKMEFVNKKYLPGNEDVLPLIIRFLEEIIYNPQFENNLFKNEIIEREKNSILQKILSKKENKIQYAVFSTENILNTESIAGCYLFGEEDIIRSITSDKLQYQYMNIINNSNIDVIVSGNLDGYDDIKEKIENTFEKYQKSDIKLIQNNEYSEKKEPIEINEDIDAYQSILTFGMNVLDVKNADIYKIMVYNAMLGTTPSSKLFTNFREKESLAYTVGSKLYRLKNQIIIYAGINKSNYEKSKRVIYEQLDMLKNGDFTDGELNSAKDSIISNFKTMKDSKIGMAKLFFINKYSFLENETVDNIIEKIKKVDRKDIISIANKINVDCIYLLGGTKDA